MKRKYKVQGLKFKVEQPWLLWMFLLFIFNFSFLLGNSQSLAPLTANSGANTNVCPGDSVMLGGNPAATGGTPPYTYSWQPTTSLDLPNSPNPKAFPGTPTNYTLTVTDASSNAATDVVNVSIFTPPVVSAGIDQTILSGFNTSLTASGAMNYYWTPTDPLTNQNTANPTAEPVATTTFCVVGIDGNGCLDVDCMTLNVIDSDQLVIYNSFTPNGDGINDFFYFGNIQKYPENKLEVYNRNGKLVYQKSPYMNEWFGRIDGVDLPCATYYYVLYPGNGKEKINGAVTIIR